MYIPQLWVLNATLIIIFRYRQSSSLIGLGVYKRVMPCSFLMSNAHECIPFDGALLLVLLVLNA